MLALMRLLALLVPVPTTAMGRNSGSDNHCGASGLGIDSKRLAQHSLKQVAESLAARSCFQAMNIEVTVHVRNAGLGVLMVLRLFRSRLL